MSSSMFEMMPSFRRRLSVASAAGTSGKGFQAAMESAQRRGASGPRGGGAGGGAAGGGWGGGGGLGVGGGGGGAGRGWGAGRGGARGRASSGPSGRCSAVATAAKVS